VKQKKQNPVRISYETYAHLRAILEQERGQLHTDFLKACSFLTGVNNSVLSEIKCQRDARITVMLEELHAAAQASYKDHPKKEMREFWGLK